MVNVSRYTSLFSFYGSKSRIGHLYPAPVHETIIEPFAGSAAYAFRYYDRYVILNELDERIVALWQFLLSPDALRWIEHIVSDTIEPGVRVSTLLPHDAPPGLRELLRAEANRGTQGTQGVHEQVTSLAAGCWHRIKPKMRIWLPRIRHWTLRIGSYDALSNTLATWFIDPPYSNLAGTKYRCTALDYDALAEWAKSRQGQVIVCENDGATWLPFSPLTVRRGILSHYQKSRAVESVWTNLVNE